MAGRVPFHLPLCYYGHVYKSAGVIMLPPKPTQCQNAPSKQKAAEAVRQPIYNMMPPMISEFKYITSFPCVRTPLAKPEEWNATLARELIFSFFFKALAIQTRGQASKRTTPTGGLEVS